MAMLFLFIADILFHRYPVTRSHQPYLPPRELESVQDVTRHSYQQCSLLAVLVEYALPETQSFKLDLCHLPEKSKPDHILALFEAETLLPLRCRFCRRCLPSCRGGHLSGKHREDLKADSCRTEWQLPASRSLTLLVPVVLQNPIFVRAFTLQ